MPTGSDEGGLEELVEFRLSRASKSWTLASRSAIRCRIAKNASLGERGRLPSRRQVSQGTRLRAGGGPARLGQVRAVRPGSGHGIHALLP